MIRRVLIAVSALGACTTTHQIRRPDSVEQIQPLYTNARFSMTLLHERPPGAMSPAPVPVAPNPTAAFYAGAPLVDLSNLRGYRIKRRGRAALQGWGFGSLAGLVAGVALGFADGDDPACSMQSEDSCIFRFSAEDKATAFGIAGILVGGLVGTLIGTAVGYTDEYIFRDAPAEP